MKTYSKKIVILGGGYSGLLAAIRLTGKTRRQAVEVTLVNASETFMERVRLHQVGANQTIRVYAIESLLSGTGVNFVQGWITKLEPNSQTVSVQTTSGATELEYDHLIYALGSAAVADTIPGVAEHAYAIGTQQATQALASHLPSVSAGKGTILVVGGGLTGIETATEIAESYPDVQVVLATRGRLGEELSRKGGIYLRTVFERLHIRLLEDVEIEQLEAGQAHHTEGDTIRFDLCIWAGSFGVSPLARDVGILVDAQDRIIVNEYLQSVSHPAIYAIGDAASNGLVMACATAMPMGAYAADYLAAMSKEQPLPKPFDFAYLIQCISLGRKRGLVQQLHADNTPKEQIFTGWIGAKINEIIVRYTIWSFKLEKHWPGFFSWPRGGKPGKVVELGREQLPAKSFQLGWEKVRRALRGSFFENRPKSGRK